MRVAHTVKLMTENKTNQRCNRKRDGQLLKLCEVGMKLHPSIVNN